MNQQLQIEFQELHKDMADFKQELIEFIKSKSADKNKYEVATGEANENL